MEILINRRRDTALIFKCRPFHFNFTDF